MHNLYPIQITGGAILAHNYLCGDKLKPRSEVERRATYLEELEEVLDKCNGYDDLKILITECLNNNPNERPSSGDLVHQLQVLKQDDESDAVSSEVIKRGIKILEEAEKNIPPVVSPRLLSKAKQINVKV